MQKLVLLCVAGLLAVGLGVQHAYGLADFKKAFQAKYVDKSEGDSMKAAFKKAGCFTCHVKGEKKEVRNPYGDELAKLIEGDAQQRVKEAGKEGNDVRDAEKEKVLKELDKALDEVAKKKNESGELYGDRIKAGQLPVEFAE